ncbi:MAG TPA: T9SS type A sorting domain-containing protein [Bacteroidia bacterium]|nr:T9SS type A sorting domain-containing protein [Bacteroidia bacterium]
MKTKLHYYFIIAFTLVCVSVKVNAQMLVQFWDFNQIPAAAISDSFGTADSYMHTQSVDSTMGEWPLTSIYAAPSLAHGHIVYSRPTIHYNAAGTGIRDSILDADNTTGSVIYDYSSSNYPYFTSSDSALGNGFIRARNPSDSCEMYLFIPTTGYKNISMQYAIAVSGTSSAQFNILSYSVNGMAGPWKNLTTAMDTFNVGGVRTPDTLLLINSVTIATDVWYPEQINFTSDPSVNNNPNFILRWQIAGNYSSGASHNDRYDNIAVWATGPSGIDELPAQEAGYTVYPNPVSDFVNVVSDKYTGAKIITLYNVIGQTINVTENKDRQTSINTSSLTSGVYFVEIKEESTGNKYTVKIVK